MKNKRDRRKYFTVFLMKNGFPEFYMELDNLNVNGINVQNATICPDHVLVHCNHELAKRYIEKRFGINMTIHRWEYNYLAAYYEKMVKGDLVELSNNDPRKTSGKTVYPARLVIINRQQIKDYIESHPDEFADLLNAK